MRQGADIIRIAKVDKFIVDETGIIGLTFLRNKHQSGVIFTKPSLAIIRLFLVKSQIDGFIRLIIPLVFNFV
jgi:hypothetical protein